MKHIASISAARGNGMALHLPEVGLVGNSHMLMLERNNLEIADLILEWMGDNIP